ncbi:hypothetical protein GCM10010211_33860 [Streptomyces albospinus]|uniref:Ketosynthase family 3 (KS3) domain-containing protein n=1 Tax=Streptomyces albospinus TaxID=285515 RepID=A0ABQ2V2U7_9ACTN|nr:hypothetical protein GCM10010211_33860 [Streptomyces albospinus]
MVLAGGSESTRDRMTAALFSCMGALSARRADPATASRPFDSERDGFVLGEGDSVLVLERTEHARRRGARIRAYLTGYGASSDAHHVTVPDPEGHGAEVAVESALADAGCTPADIDHVNAHGTSTPLNDASEARMLRRVFPHAPVITANKSVIGHSLGAAGAVEAAFTVLSLQHRTVPPAANLHRQEPGLELDIVTGRPRPVPGMRAALTRSVRSLRRSPAGSAGVRVRRAGGRHTG